MGRESRKAFGQWIRTIRKKKELSLSRVSDSLAYKTSGLINSVESGNASLPVDKIHPLARVLEIDVTELLDKIKECEPELYEKYQTIRRDIARYLVYGPDAPKVDQSIYYQNPEQCELDLPWMEQPAHPDQLSIFPQEAPHEIACH